MVHRGPHDQAALLGRIRRAGDEPALSLRGSFDEVIDEEQGRRLHDRIGPPGEELAVAAELVVPPEVLAQPGAAGRPDAVIRWR